MNISPALVELAEPSPTPPTTAGDDRRGRERVDSMPDAVVQARPMTQGPSLTSLEGKVALVTGAGRMRSIGRTIAETLAGAGADVVVTGSGKPRERYPEDEKAAGWRDVESVAESIRNLGRRALPLVADVTNEDEIAELGAKIRAEFGRLDIIVNNAGAAIGNDRVPVFELTPSEWRRVIDTNLTGPFLVCHLLGPVLVESGVGGSIVNISSVVGKSLRPNAAAYVASKAGLHGLTASLAGELGDAGVRVNAICPGLIETSRTDHVGRGEMWHTLISRLPLKRVGSPSDIANLAVFLCTDQASWITGQFICVDGGQIMQP
jgi:3-oxoacyl-[acyl-carrier protein] reductase